MGRGRQDHEIAWKMKRSEKRGGPYGARLRSVYAEVQWQRFVNRDFRLFCQFGAISAHLRAEIIERRDVKVLKTRSYFDCSRARSELR